MQSDIIDTLLNIKEISVIAVMSGAIWFLITDRNNLRDQIKHKDNKIMNVIESHQADLKESNRDLQSMSEKWAIMFGQLRDIIKDSKT